MSGYTQGRRDGYSAGYEAGLNAGDTLLGHATEFRFLLYPEGHQYWDIAAEAVLVTWRGDGRWTVKNHGFCYDAGGHPEYEPIPSERGDEFKERFRFDRDEAVRIAGEVVVPQLRAIWNERLAKKAASSSVGVGHTDPRTPTQP